MSLDSIPATSLQKTHSRPGLGLVTDFLVRYGVLAMALVLIVAFSILIPGFASLSTTTAILQAQAVAALCALGMTLAAVVGDLDLSVGATAGLSVTVAALVMIRFNLTGATAILLCLLAGAAVGCLNAVLIVFLKIPDLLATLGVMFTIQGLKKWLVDGQTLTTGMTLPNGEKMPGRFTSEFSAVDGSKLLGIPFSVILLILIGFLVWVFLERTRYGRLFYAVGGNPEAARLAGVHVNRHRFAAYAISGVLASVAGIILASRLRQGDVTAGDSVLLDAVAMTLIGFAVLGARKPNALGTLVGAVFIGVLLYGLTRLGLSYFTQDLIKGLVLLLSLILSFSLARKRVR